ncbi:NAD-dependent dehydratase [Flagellimonas taeanensis]|uniref:NAD(P)H-binding protein n=1 Tax=Flavobacteriaceae TaxID=49546 RepID=UPI000E69F349|nr:MULTISPECIES: NAD(P)H-binding protein [Allomuricauda]MDC6385805.1 NAD(P)H-binding protein [Muricauda sp. SK9]RIV50918.1 NAD-dependent dehydratase [Allomuricauda taeanensis]
MKITLTGSLGHIGKPLTKKLIEGGHEVTVISSNPLRGAAIQKMGASARIGNLEDAGFLTDSFHGADAVFTMVPPNNYFDPNLDLISYYARLGKNYALALLTSKAKRVVNLSTIGGHLEKGNGILKGANQVEQTLNTLVPDITLTHVRPTAFYYNLYGYMEMIKTDKAIFTNYGTKAIPWVSPRDIAETVGEELVRSGSAPSFRYVVSEELNGQETAAILGRAIGVPELSWQVISDNLVVDALKSIGMNPAIAEGLTEMYAAMESGLLTEHFEQHRPEPGKVRLTDFVKEFTVAYQNNH